MRTIGGGGEGSRAVRQPHEVGPNGAKRLARGIPEAPPRTTRSATAVDIARGAATDHGTAEAARFSAFLSAMVTENRSAALRAPGHWT